MPSFEMLYDEEGDVLDVTFETFDENFARTVMLNDNIIIYTDLSFSCAWGISFYSYARLLGVSETHLDGLRSLPESEARQILHLVQSFPLTYSLEALAPDELRARVKAPHLQDLL